MTEGHLQSFRALRERAIGRFRGQRGEVDRSRYIPTLDGWRAIAILLVISHHAGTAFYSEESYYANSPTRFGTWGVPVFFALSGLLITKLLLEEFDRTGSISLASFYIRRAFRILPPASLFILTIGALGLLVSRMEMVSCFLFFRNYLPEYLGGLYTDHFWSLAVEEHFYLIWPGLLVWVGVRRGLRAAAFLSLVFALWISVDYHFHMFARLLPNVTSQYRTDLRLDGLFCGCTMAFLFNQPTSREWLRRHYSFVVWVLSACGIAFCLRYQPYLAVFWIAVLIPLLMVGTALHPEWVVSRFLDLAPIKWIGRISYSLYLWQQMFLVPSWKSKPFPAIQHWPVNIIVLLVVASASYYLVEKPLIRLGHKLAARYRTWAQESSAPAWTPVAFRGDS